MKLFGLNLGGFFSQVEAFSKVHLNTFITEEDVIRIKNWNFNCLRLPVDYFFLENQEEPYNIIEERISKIEQVLHWAQKYDTELILDLHKAPGHTFDTREDKINNIWDKNSLNRKRFLKIWAFIAKRFRDQKNIIYEILNEPIAPQNRLWYDLAEEAIKTIRTIDTDHDIIIESNLWGEPGNFSDIPKFSDDNIIYSFHYYEPHWVTHQMAEWITFYLRNIHRKIEKYPGYYELSADKFKQLKDHALLERVKNELGKWDKERMESSLEPILEFRDKYNVPILCGEFGCIAKADLITRKNWIEDLMSILKKNKISYTYWTYKNMDFGIYDFTEKYQDNPNYQNEQRIDEMTLNVLKNAIF